MPVDPLRPAARRRRAPPAGRPAAGPPLREFGRSLPMALLRTREAVMARFRPILRQHDLTEQQWRVLRALIEQPAAVRASELSQLTVLSLPSLSRLLKTLEERGLVRRDAHASDQRATQLSITRSGRALVSRIAPLSEATYAGIEAAVGRDELGELYRLLAATAQRLQE